jgi:hypothetical protein
MRLQVSVSGLDSDLTELSDVRSPRTRDDPAQVRRSFGVIILFDLLLPPLPSRSRLGTFHTSTPTPYQFAFTWSRLIRPTLYPAA